MDIGGKVKKLRKEMGLTQEELGILVGLPQTSISSIENKDSNTGVKTLLRIAEALDVTLEELLK